MEVTTSERHASGGEAPELPAQNLVKAFYEQVDRLGDDLAIRDEAREKSSSAGTSCATRSTGSPAGWPSSASGRATP